MVRFFFFIIIIIASYKLGSLDFFPPNKLGDFVQERLVPLVQRMPKNPIGPSYWFEIESTIGWEKVILVFGYADNLDVCNYMMPDASDAGADRLQSNSG
jgi:hypothetical protein